jgi:hypothetical protein
MTLTQIFLAGVSGLAILAIGTIAFLPRDVTVTRTATVGAAPKDIVALAASNTGYQTFNPYRTTDPELKIEAFGPATGVGSGFRFDGKEGKGTQTVAAVDETSVRYDIDLGAMGTPTQMISAVAQENGSQVTWEMHADLGFNPIARVMGLFMNGMIGPTFERGLQNLDTSFSAS